MEDAALTSQKRWFESISSHLRVCSSVVERFVDIEEVVGPIPTRPTIITLLEVL